MLKFFDQSIREKLMRKQFCCVHFLHNEKLKCLFDLCLQAKVQQLYRLDRLLQEESVTIQSLQQDKVNISLLMNFLLISIIKRNQ